MAAKTLLEVFLVTIFVSFAACQIATKRCTKQSDCDVPKECCSQRFLQDESYCVPRRRLDEICLDGPLAEVMTNNTYSITCPCEVELTCIKEEWYSDTGSLIYQRNPRCRKATFEQPPLEFYIGSNTINTGYEPYGNAGSYAYAGPYGNANAGPYGNANARPYGNANAGPYSNADAGSYAFIYRRK